MCVGKNKNKIMENLCNEMTEQLFEQLFGKFAIMNQTDACKKATIRTAITHVALKCSNEDNIGLCLVDDKQTKC